MRIGCIGLGRIGAPIAAHLAAAGHHVVGHDIRPDKKTEMERVGVGWSDAIAQLVADVDAVINCVLSPKDVEQVLLGENAFLAAARPGQIFVEASTLDPASAVDHATRLSQKGVRYLDCPVSGGADGAAAGTLTVIVGGETETLDAMRPAFSCFARHVFHVGGVGAGSTMKAIVQAIFLSHMATFLEALSLGLAAGLPIATQLAVISETTSHHPTLGKRYQQIIEGDLHPRFEVTSAIKDLAIVRELAAAAAFDADLVEACYRHYRSAAERGHGGDDLIALLRRS